LWKRLRPVTWIALAGAIILVLLYYLTFLPRVRQPEIAANPEKSLAVLPFHYYNSDPEAEDIGDAFSNEIITQLYKVKGFDCIKSHTSTLQYKGENRKSSGY
jgi:TolB-like protein